MEEGPGAMGTQGCQGGAGPGVGSGVPRPERGPGPEWTAWAPGTEWTAWAPGRSGLRGLPGGTLGILRPGPMVAGCPLC